MSLFFDTNNFTLDATPPDKGLATWSAIQDALSSSQQQASPFESPLGVSSIGSPNSTRDFDESPLLPFDSEPAVVNNNFPLFEVNSTPAATVPQPSAAPAPRGATNSYEDYRTILLNLYLKHQAEQQAIPSQQQQQASQQQATIPAYLLGTTPSQQQQSNLVPTNPVTLLGQFANPTSSPLNATSMGTAFASLSDIAPATKPWELPFALQSHDLTNLTNAIHAKTMAESVSSQESTASKTSPASATSPSTTSTPMSSQGSDSNALSTGSEPLSQLAAVFLREYARHRPAQDTSTLVRAFDVAGIQVADQVLEDVGVTSPFAALAAPSPPSKEDFNYTKEDGSTSSVFDDYFMGHQFPAQSSPSPAQSAKSHSPPATKARSSAQHTSKHAALGTSDGAILVNGKRLFQCDVCNKTFDRAFNMKTHRMIHEDTREYNFICPFEECGKAFARKADCNRHTKTVHLKRGEKLPQEARIDFG